MDKIVLGEGEIINFDQLGQSFAPLNTSNWESYLETEKEKVNNRLKKKIIPTSFINNFLFKKLLGTGTFGTVVLVKHEETQIYYAGKIVRKAVLNDSKTLQHIRNERQILSVTRFPFSVYMDYYLKDKEFLYFIMPVALGGELLTHLQKVEKLNEKDAKFYAAQVLLAFEYLHYMDIIYRDLKPENVLIDHLGYVKLTDFGFCKILLGRTYTFCGTPEYMAPEIILNKGYGKAVDWWSFGIFVYELLAGYTPFTSKRMSKIYENILLGTYRTPNHFSEQVKHLIQNLLQNEPTKRYGNLSAGIRHIKNHKWFQNVKWLNILDRKVVPPFTPKLKTIDDTKYFTTSLERTSVNIMERFDQRS